MSKAGRKAYLSRLWMACIQKSTCNFSHLPFKLRVTKVFFDSPILPMAPAVLSTSWRSRNRLVHDWVRIISYTFFSKALTERRLVVTGSSCKLSQSNSSDTLNALFSSRLPSLASDIAIVLIHYPEQQLRRFRAPLSQSH